MFKKIHNDVVISSLLSSLPGVVHGYSTRVSGDMDKDHEKRHAFLGKLGLSDALFFVPEQVHRNVIAYADGRTPGEITGADGIVARLHAKRDGVPVALGVFGADCVPLLLVDRISGVYAVAHAGWKGTLAEIAVRVVDTMKKHGANAEDIHVSIGPHIEACCYTVPFDRAQQFARISAGDAVVTGAEGDVRISLGRANYLQLVSCGILSSHIDAPPGCTSCQNAEYFSFRKDSKRTFGEQMGVITMVC
jgi:YfiH family protein